MTSSNPRRVGQSELGAFLASCRSAFLGIGLMTAMINVLYLTGSFFMLEIYDRVLPSRSIPTLSACACSRSPSTPSRASLDLIRGRVLVRIGAVARPCLERGGCSTSSCACRFTPAARATACSPCAISIRSAASLSGPGRPRSSTCPGCRSISASAFSSIPGSAAPRSPARCSSSGSPC